MRGGGWPGASASDASSQRTPVLEGGVPGRFSFLLVTKTTRYTPGVFQHYVYIHVSSGGVLCVIVGVMG